MSQKDKAKFRSTGKWKKFRAYMKSKYKKDALTGKILYKGWNLHHMNLNETYYQDLVEEHFLCLNKTSHDVIHFLYNVAKYKGIQETIDSLSDILYKMKEINSLI